jgi:hypothetical protein
MAAKTPLKLLFAAILLLMLAVSIYASSHQALTQWSGLSAGQDRYWTLATLCDAYCGFLTFYAWLFYKESGWPARLAWFVAIMVLGNMAMASYVLWQLAKLRKDQPASAILLKTVSR